MVRIEPGVEKLWLTIVQRQGGTIRARTLYDLSDGTQVNAIFEPDGLRSFDAEWKSSRWGELESVRVKVLPLRQVIASKPILCRRP